MNIEILHIDGCPGWQEAGVRTYRALEAMGMSDVEVRFRRISTADEARSTPFAGSPTILIDGRDAFSAAETVTELSCRLYPTPEGLRDLPTLSQIIEAIRAHRI